MTYFGLWYAYPNFLGSDLVCVWYCLRLVLLYCDALCDLCCMLIIFCS
jgi:hypothetical protein